MTKTDNLCKRTKYKSTSKKWQKAKLKLLEKKSKRTLNVTFDPNYPMAPIVIHKSNHQESTNA